MVNFNAAKQGLEFINYVIHSGYDAYYDFTFQTGDKGKRLPDVEKKPLYHYIMDMTDNSYYGNILDTYITGIIKSQKSNRENYIEDTQDEIESMQKKVDGLKETLDNKEKLKAQFISYSKTHKWKQPYKKCSIKVDKDGILTGFKIDAQPYEKYERKVDADMKRIRSQIKSIENGIERRKQKKVKLETLPPKKAVFGSKDLYRKKDTVGNNEAWKEEFHYARNHNVTISGRKDSPNGNWVAKWDPKTHDLHWTLPGKDKKEAIFPDFLPVTYQDEFLHLLDNENAAKHTISYMFELRKDHKGREYFLVKATYDLPVKRVNYYIGDGVIAVDTNADRLAWSNIDGKGNLIAHGVVPMELDGLSSTQIDQVIGQAVNQITQICVMTHKILVIEDLDASAMRKNMKYKSPKRNKVISLFAVNNLLDCYTGQGYKYGFMIGKVKPAYTSFIGKLVHMRKYGLSVHEAASYEIGLRFMGLGSEVPVQYHSLFKKGYPDSVKGNADKEYYYRWKTVYSALSDTRAHAFFLNVPAKENKTQFKQWFKENDEIFTADKHKEKAAQDKAQGQSASSMEIKTQAATA